VLDLEAPHSDSRRRIAIEIEAAIRHDRAEAIVLGCAGMADLAADFSAGFGLPVIEGVSAAVKLIEALASLGITTSKIGAFASPPVKDYKGPFQARFSPSRLWSGDRVR
jgi:allantoin racemase